MYGKGMLLASIRRLLLRSWYPLDGPGCCSYGITVLNPIHFDDLVVVPEEARVSPN